jgi:hypothetical protein
MKNTAAIALLTVLQSHGVGVCDTPEVLAALLRKRARTFPGDVKALLAAVTHGVVSQLRHDPRRALDSLARTLQQCAHLPPDKAEWVVQAWAAGLAAARPVAPPRLVNPKTAAAVGFAAAATVAAYLLFGP